MDSEQQQRQYGTTCTFKEGCLGRYQRSKITGHQTLSQCLTWPLELEISESTHSNYHSSIESLSVLSIVPIRTGNAGGSTTTHHTPHITHHLHTTPKTADPMRASERASEWTNRGIHVGNTGLMGQMEESEQVSKPSGPIAPELGQGNLNLNEPNGAGQVEPAASLGKAVQTRPARCVRSVA